MPACWEYHFTYFLAEHRPEEPGGPTELLLSWNIRDSSGSASVVLYCRQGPKWGQKLSEVSLSRARYLSLCPWDTMPSIHPELILVKTQMHPVLCIRLTPSIPFHIPSNPSFSIPFHSVPLYSTLRYSSPFHFNVLITYSKLHSKKEAVIATKVKMIRFFSQGALRLTMFHSIHRFIKPKPYSVTYNRFQSGKWNTLWNNLDIFEYFWLLI